MNEQSKANSPRQKGQFRFFPSSTYKNTNHNRHGGDHHRLETWARNQKTRDLRKFLDEKKVAYEKVMVEYEKYDQQEKSLVIQIDSESAIPTNTDMLNNILELKRKIEGKSGQEIGESSFSKKLEAESKQKNIKHYNFNLFDGLGDLEEHLSYFDQLALHYEYNDLTRCRFFTATF